MENPKQHVKFTAAILIIILQLTSSNKPNARPVYEVINEQSRIDDRIRISTSPGVLPYGNPLAGNSKQNARLHASNQQAMFNAERIRQHKAQLQRQTNVPRVVDSYMKAYHESQESHQLALEQQQATIADSPVTNAPMRSPSRQKQRVQIKKRGPITLPPSQDLSKLNPTVTNRGQSRRQNIPKRGTLSPGPEPSKITKDDAIQNKNRNYRSYGSADYQQYLEPPKYRTVYVSPVPDYEEGVTIKPNGNVGLAHHQSKAPSKLYTEAVPSNSKYVYSKQYMPIESLKSTQDIKALNSLLNKNPVQQLSEFNALLAASNEESNKELPIDLYFYLKDPKTQTLSKNYEQLNYAQNPITYTNAGGSDYKIKDHTPITEEVDDIENPIEDQQQQQYYTQPVPPTKATLSEVSTTKSNKYYKVEVASQTITGPKPGEDYSNDPTYQISHYGPSYGEHDDSKSEQYLHMNTNPTGVQHLSGDGTEVSAFGDDNLKYAANYEFGYRVRDADSANYYGHREAKDGENTRGHYHVLLPDGRMQQVKYVAGPDGFHADISYDKTH